MNDRQKALKRVAEIRRQKLAAAQVTKRAADASVRDAHTRVALFESRLRDANAAAKRTLATAIKDAPDLADPETRFAAISGALAAVRERQRTASAHLGLAHSQCAKAERDVLAARQALLEQQRRHEMLEHMAEAESARFESHARAREEDEVAEAVAAKQVAT